MGNKVRLALFDDPVNEWLPRLGPVSRVRAYGSRNLGGDPVRDSSRRRLGIDLCHP